MGVVNVINMSWVFLSHKRSRSDASENMEFISRTSTLEHRISEVNNETLVSSLKLSKLLMSKLAHTGLGSAENELCVV
jgi:hypothetical protein